MIRKKEFTASLSEVNASVDTVEKKGFWKKLFAFLGPAYLVSVGYMDPGNWATDIAGGSRYGYSLLWVLLMSNIIALLLQSLSARLGLVRGRDLAQVSRETYPPFINFCLYILAEIAIAACDLAEVLGMAIGINLLFDIPLMYGVLISVLDTFLLLFLINYGIRKLEAFILGLIAVIGISFLFEMIFAQPSLKEVARGFIPSIPDDTALYIAIGIIGATVMPHNLYLHSSLVQTRKFESTPTEIRKAIKFNFIDSAIALNLAFFVNAAILILAASAFYKQGHFEIVEIQQAYRFLEPLLSESLAPVLFAVALIAAGQSSTITGTLAGQIVMEGYINLRIQPWMRRMLTRIIAIVPAVIAIQVMGEQATGRLLILSQVILSLQLGFAIIPLIHFVSDKQKMKEFVISAPVKAFAWISALVIVSLNAKMVLDEVGSWVTDSATPLYLSIPAAAVVASAFVLLFYIMIKPMVRPRVYDYSTPHGTLLPIEESRTKHFKNIAITVDFSSTDSTAISHALSLGGTDCNYFLIHIVETAGAIVMGKEIQDFESRADIQSLKQYESELGRRGYRVKIALGYGNPKKEIPLIVSKKDVDLLVMGAHGHKGIKDLFFGTTVETVRHKLNIPLFVVKKEEK